MTRTIKTMPATSSEVSLPERPAEWLRWVSGVASEFGSSEEVEEPVPGMAVAEDITANLAGEERVVTKPQEPVEGWLGTQNESNKQKI
jgi:hypothetical protein